MLKPLPITQAKRIAARLFWLEWDNAKMKSRAGGYEARAMRAETHRTIGTHYLETGLVTLATGTTFESLSEMERLLEQNGRYSIEWEG